MSFPVRNAAWTLVKRPTADLLVEGEHLVLTESDIPSIADGQVLLRSLSLSVDPTQRVWATDQPQYMPPSPLNEPLRAMGVFIVEASKNEKLPVGTAVVGMSSLQKFVVASAEQAAQFAVVDIKALPVGAYLALFSFIGLTAYHGLMKICKPKAGEVLVVTGAAGATGSLVVQLGKFAGCFVIGIAGSDEKTAWLTNELGCDVVINYKTQDVAKQLDLAAPNGIDCLFENVGGSIMEAVLQRMNNYGRVALCGLISSYNSGVGWGPANFAMVLMRRLTVQGYICIDHMDEFAEMSNVFTNAMKEGKLKYRTHEIDGFEKCVSAINGLFAGANMGKTLVVVSKP